MGFYRCNGTCTTGAFSPNGRLILVGTTDGVATIFDLSTRSPVADLRGHTGSVLGVVFGPDGRQAVTTGGDGTVQVWDVQKGRQLRVLRGHDAPVTRVAFSPNGRLIATAGDDGTVRLWTTDEPPPRDNSMSFADLVRLATSRLPVTLNSNERARLLLVTERTRGATSR